MSATYNVRTIKKKAYIGTVSGTTVTMKGEGQSVYIKAESLTDFKMHNEVVICSKEDFEYLLTEARNNQ